MYRYREKFVESQITENADINDKNTDLGEAIKNMQSAQSKFESTNDMHPIKLDLYAELRCGMAHASLRGTYELGRSKSTG